MGLTVLIFLLLHRWVVNPRPSCRVCAEFYDDPSAIVHSSTAALSAVVSTWVPPEWCERCCMAQARLVGLGQRCRLHLFTVGRRRVCKWSAAGPRPHRPHLPMDWARYGYGERSRRSGPCRLDPALPDARLARWGWRAAGVQRLSRSGMSAAYGLRLSLWRLSAARSSRLRGRMVRLASLPRQSSTYNFVCCCQVILYCVAAPRVLSVRGWVAAA